MPEEEIPETGSNPTFDDLSPVMTFLDREEAIIAKGFLESQGINAILSSDETMRARRGVSSPTGIRLLIKKEDMQRVEDIFRLLGIYPEEKPNLLSKECPDIPTKGNWKHLSIKIVLIVSLLLITILILIYFIHIFAS